MIHGIPLLGLSPSVASLWRLQRGPNLVRHKLGAGVSILVATSICEATSRTRTTVENERARNPVCPNACNQYISRITKCDRLTSWWMMTLFGKMRRRCLANVVLPEHVAPLRTDEPAVHQGVGHTYPIPRRITRVFIVSGVPGGRTVRVLCVRGNLLMNPCCRHSEIISLTSCEADFSTLLRLGGGVEYNGGQVNERRRARRRVHCAISQRVTGLRSRCAG